MYVLERIELQIANVKEEAFGRKDILDKVEKWLAACEEECWLEEYNRVCYDPFLHPQTCFHIKFFPLPASLF